MNCSYSLASFLRGGFRSRNVENESVLDTEMYITLVNMLKPVHMLHRYTALNNIPTYCVKNSSPMVLHADP